MAAAERLTMVGREQMLLALRGVVSVARTAFHLVRQCHAFCVASYLVTEACIRDNAMSPTDNAKSSPQLPTRLLGAPTRFGGSS